MISIDDPKICDCEPKKCDRELNAALFLETKEGLLRIAGDFDVLADRAEKRLRFHASLQPTDSPEPDRGEQFDNAAGASEGEESMAATR